MDIIFTGAIPIKSSYASKLCILVYLLHRGEHEKYLFLSLYGNTENPLMTVRAPRID